MRFEIQKHTKRGIDCLERIGKLCTENDSIKMAKTPTCTLFMSTGNVYKNFSQSFSYQIEI